MCWNVIEYIFIHYLRVRVYQFRWCLVGEVATNQIVLLIWYRAACSCNLSLSPLEASERAQAAELMHTI